MDTLFGFICYQLFGRYWILYTMRSGLREALFASEMEHNLAMRTHREYMKEKEGFEKELEAVKNDDTLTPESKRSKVDDLKKDISNREIMMQGADGEIGRTRSLVINNRRKYEFVRTYRLR